MRVWRLFYYCRHCEEYEAAIEAAGGIDLQLLGVGRMGHIGFNERGWDSLRSLHPFAYFLHRPDMRFPTTHVLHCRMMCCAEHPILQLLVRQVALSSLGKLELSTGYVPPLAQAYRETSC